ncbi:phage tail-collar fiber domain-containing protein [Methylobacterium radiotolerans]|uniref:phage tail-collar fiber domain-containing protein n=1 Tax=Methylobacterium radiotolerans TaxID=31998 RepID=UPI001F4418F7|nr:phage tail protein [Methylobacterium radiotolerans]UIY44146.1 phage tail protein [Methylobacterium radiotolerans]
MSAALVPTFTRAGLAKVRNAQSTGVQAVIASLAIGRGLASDGGYIGYVPDGTETALRGEIGRAVIYQGEPLGGVAGSDPIGFRVMSVFPQLAAGTPAYAVIEVGIFLDDGTLLAVWSTPSQADRIGDVTANAIFELAFDLYLTAVPVAALTITVQQSSTDNLACLAELLRGVTRNYTRQMRATHRLARRGIKE